MFLRHFKVKKSRGVFYLKIEDVIKEVIKMRYSAIWVFIFLCLSKTLVLAQINGVNINSENYSVSGSYSYEWWQGDGFSLDPGNVLYSTDSGTFGGSSNDGTPLNVNYAAPSPPRVFPTVIFGQPWTSGLSVNHNIGTFSYQFNSAALGNDFPVTSSGGSSYYMTGANYSFIKSTAQANWLFQPIAANEQITMNISQGGSYFQDQNLVVTLSDVTAVNTLMNYSYVSVGLDYVSNSYDFSLNPNDQYQLSITSTSDIFDNDILSQQFSASVEPAPEPSTLCMFSFAAAVLIAARKHTFRSAKDG
jgi:hypothetical protein